MSVSISTATLLLAIVAVVSAVRDDEFVRRNGSTLLLNGESFRFSGANIYWLGLDENVPPGTVAYPTHFRVDDALETAKLMGSTVVRSHTLGVSTGNPLSFEPRLNEWNLNALAHVDYAIYRAGQLGLKLIIPLTDNYHYYHGGKHCFTDWLNVSEAEFYVNEAVIAAFEAYISHLLSHVNNYTGLRYADDPAVMAWETGNELLPPPQWTKRIAAFIKGIAPNHLVLSGTYGVSLAELGLDDVDIHSDHFYPPDAVRLELGAALCKSSSKAYVAGEWGWRYNGSVTAFLNASQRSSAAGDLYWSLFPHADDFGFVQHNDGFTMHYSGDWPFMVQRRLEITAHAAAMRGQHGSPPNASVVTSPVLHDIFATNNTLTWRGAAGACSYDVFRGFQSAFSAIAKGLTDNSTPWVDSTAPASTQPVSYFVVPVDCNGNFGPKSNVVMRK